MFSSQSNRTPQRDWAIRGACQLQAPQSPANRAIPVDSQKSSANPTRKRSNERPELLAIGQAIQTTRILVNKDLASRKSFQKRISLGLVAQSEVQAAGRRHHRRIPS